MTTAPIQFDRSRQQRVLQAPEKAPASASHSTTPAKSSGAHTSEKVRVSPAAQHSMSNQAMQRMVRNHTLQRKLTINRPGDIYEQEADRVADAVMRMPDPTAGSSSPSVTSLSSVSTLRRCSCAQSSSSGECEECKAKRSLQRSAESASASTEAPPIVHDALRSPGQPLDQASRSFLEPRFGRDLSGVRLHTGRQAAESARAVNALAYTVGNSVVFAEGQYVPHTWSGRRLIAHELAHTVQQSSAPAAEIRRQHDGGAVPPSTPPASTTTPAPDPTFTLEGTPDVSARPSLVDRSDNLATDISFGDFSIRASVRTRAPAGSNPSDWQVGIIQMVSGPVDTTCFRRDIDPHHPPAPSAPPEQVYVRRLERRPGPFYPDKDPAYPGVFTDSSSARTVRPAASSPGGDVTTVADEDHPGFQSYLAASAYTQSMRDTNVWLNRNLHHGFFYTYVAAVNSVSGRILPLYTARWWMSADYTFINPGYGIPFTPVRHALVFQIAERHPFRSSDFFPITTGITMNEWSRSHYQGAWEPECPSHSREIIRAGGG